jgi:NADP-dependent 3-hydroxy acid dehydrogenase YdfG
MTTAGTLAKMTDEDWQKVIAVNLSGAFYMAQAAAGHMIERGTGRIINVSSVIGETGNIGQVNYAGVYRLWPDLQRGTGQRASDVDVRGVRRGGAPAGR